jgi:O-antigen/teichoic acid export membrane protein
MGLAQSIVRFYPHFSKDEVKGKSFINSILMLSVVGYGIFILIFFLLKSNIIGFFEKNAGTLPNYLSLILWMTFFLMVTTILEYYSRSLLKIVIPNFLREILTRLLQGILVTLYFVQVITFDQFLTFSVIIYLIALLILSAYLYSQGNLKFNLSFQPIPIAKTKEILLYSLLSLVGSASIVIIGKVDSVMVAGLLGLASNAVYTTAFYIATVIEIPKRAITQASAILISKAFEKNDLQEVQSIYQKTAINQLIAGALLLIGVWANLVNIFEMMPKGDFFGQGLNVVIFVGIAKLVDMAFGPNGEVIVFSKYYWFNMITVIILAFVGVVSNFIFIPRFGIIGAAYATTLALVVFNVVKWIFVYFKLGLQPFGWSSLKVILIGATVVFLNYLLPRIPNVFIDIIYRSALITISYGTPILVTNCSEEVNKVFILILNRIGIKKSE